LLKKLLSGNEAIARGAYESGVKVAAGYPGTPSTEILENFARYPGVYAEWAPNEKVALEVGIGASLGGARVMVTMKHVGVNVAADPLFTLAYTGVNGGLVLVSADDPGMHSSQNEQDNRYYGLFAKIPVLEPSDSREALEMVGLALDISEKFDIPVMLRITTRIAHSQGFVEAGEVQESGVQQRAQESEAQESRAQAGGVQKRGIKPYQKNAAKYVMLPAYGRLRHVSLEERRAKLEAYAENCSVNVIEWNDRRVGVITSGVSYQYVREVLEGASVLKLGLVNPFPAGLVKKFAAGVEKLIVVEELEPFLENHIRALGIAVTGKEFFPRVGEFSPGLVEEKLRAAGVPGDLFSRRGVKCNVNSGKKEEKPEEKPAVPARPPVPCPGCPHRGVFYVLKKRKLVVTGDIGCYTLGALPPLEAMDSCICMGASIGTATGMERANPQLKGKLVAVIGDSTFLHSGITGLLNAVYNKSSLTLIILDNRTTAMTGHQDHPGTGYTLMGEPAPSVDLEKLSRALGVNRVRTVDPLDLKALEAAVKEETSAGEPSVIIARRPCALLSKETGKPVEVQAELCTGCGMCMRLGCPAISMTVEKVSINTVLCNGCGLCAQVCKTGALTAAGKQ